MVRLCGEQANHPYCDHDTNSPPSDPNDGGDRKAKTNPNPIWFVEIAEVCVEHFATTSVR